VGGNAANTTVTIAGGGGGTTQYAVRFEYSSGLVPQSPTKYDSTTYSGSPYSDNTFNIVINSVTDVAFDFPSETNIPTNIFAYGYQASLDKYIISTVGYGTIDNARGDGFTSTVGAGNIATNTFFESFANDQITMDMTATNFGAARKSIGGTIESHVYLVFTF
tara:strand:+ start:897 stop:1385 length:489 start_codon:yes stop_codon:yes gene_type:complete